MSLNSLNFLFFFIIVALLYFSPFARSHKKQNSILLISSYFFYGFVSKRLMLLLIFITTIYYLLGIYISKDSEKRATITTRIGVIFGIGILFYFKYLNFFVSEFVSFFNSFGYKISSIRFTILIPLGISFFTFRLISYLIEINRGHLQATTDFTLFATYVAFFPTIMSGPIDRPTNFIPQLTKKRLLENNLAVDGCRQILWGLFKKMIIADNLATITESVWNSIPDHNGLTLLITAMLFMIQMYCDFSGYSDLAIGFSKLLGLRIAKNFNYPFFSRNVAEYWRGWHMSLTKWLTDYVFMPLNVKFRNYGKIGLSLAIIINMIVVGLWHGANLTYVVFGLYHGLLFIPLIISGKFLANKKIKQTKRGFPFLKDVLQMFLTFLLVTLGVIVFKSASLDQAFEYYKGIVTFSKYSFSDFSIFENLTPILAFVIAMFILEWKYRNFEYPLAQFGLTWKRIYRWGMYYIIFLMIINYSGIQQQFIYFKF